MWLFDLFLPSFFCKSGMLFGYLEVFSESIGLPDNESGLYIVSVRATCLMTRQPGGSFLCGLPEKGRKVTEELEIEESGGKMNDSADRRNTNMTHTPTCCNRYSHNHHTTTKTQ